MRASETKVIPRKRIRFHIFVFLFPALIIYTLFMMFPIFDSLRISFYAMDSERIPRFAGLDNYVELLSTPKWREDLLNALRNSSVFFFINFCVQNPVALFLAALLATKTKGGAAYRALLYAPTTLSLVVVGFVWQMLLSPIWGIVKTPLEAMGLPYHPWLGLESTALIAMALISSWQYIGVPILLYYTALIAIPEQLIEAAHIDGASGWKIFWTIKFPLILPVAGVISIMTYIFNFNAFDIIYALKGPLAGPNMSTDTMMSFFYRTFFGHEFQQPNPEMGAAIAGLILCILLIGVLIYYFWQKKIENYEL
ncbi:carbohydrate ABC transporter membrane protein 1, CUT1 family [Paenibacillaceae bacterium GAS479]|nr:carbohydrate ABC transporter membrane protein 1, CUT1 family [Paenibacillaceae bacterium GAS479]